MVINKCRFVDLGIKYIVTQDWLEDSAADRKAIDLETPSMYKKYIVNNPDKEKLYKFSLKKTLSMPRGPAAMPRIFTGVVFYVTEGVFALLII